MGPALIEAQGWYRRARLQALIEQSAYLLQCLDNLFTLLSDMDAPWFRVLHRASFALAVLWLVGFFFVQRDAIDLSWKVGFSTPNSRASTKCSDVYSPEDDRLADCEYAGPGNWAEKMGKRISGESVESVLWRYYADKKVQHSVWLWWLGIPIALLSLAPLMEWVLRPVLEKRGTEKNPS